MPLAYTHLLEMMVVMYVLMAPIGLVPRLLWMAVPGCFVTTLIFYGFMCVGPSSPSPSPSSLAPAPDFMTRTLTRSLTRCVGKLMLNPFDQKMADAFEVNAFLKGTRFACLEVPLPCPLRRLNPVLTRALALPLTLTTDPFLLTTDPNQVSSAVFPARLGEEGLRFRNDPEVATVAGGKVANGSGAAHDLGPALRASRASKTAAGAGQASQIPPSGSEDGLRRRRQSPHDSPLLSAALGLGGSMDELAKFPLPMDGHMPGFKDS